MKLVGKKPQFPEKSEIEHNPPARSARLRCAEKINENTASKGNNGVMKSA
ncbi:MAG: 16S rRNA (cytosine(1402)-N(4))-methyltransferase [Spirochaetota bacterium]